MTIISHPIGSLSIDCKLEFLATLFAPGGINFPFFFIFSINSKTLFASLIFDLSSCLLICFHQSTSLPPITGVRGEAGEILFVHPLSRIHLGRYSLEPLAGPPAKHLVNYFRIFSLWKNKNLSNYMNIICKCFFVIKMIVVTCTCYRHKWEQSMTTYMSSILEIR